MNLERIILTIGGIDLGIDGRDQYVLVTDLEDVINAESEEFQEWAEYMFMYDHGSSFCNSIEFFQRTENSVICILHHRRDV